MQDPRSARSDPRYTLDAVNFLQATTVGNVQEGSAPVESKVPSKTVRRLVKEALPPSDAEEYQGSGP